MTNERAGMGSLMFLPGSFMTWRLILVNITMCSPSFLK